METQYLRTLMMVLETGSFSRAAEKLCLSQSTVSQRIKLLEDHYGCQLVDRSGSILRATPPGERVLEKTNLILIAEQEIENEMKNMGRKVQLSVGFTPTFGIVYLPKVLNLFMREKSDEVNLKLIAQQPEQSIKALIAKDFDIVVVEHCGELISEEVAYFPLPPDNLVLVSSPLLQIPSEGVTLKDLFKYHLITRREGCSSRYLLKKNLCRFGFGVDNFKGVDVYDDLHLTIKSVLLGQGVAFVSRDLVADHIQRGEVREHAIPGFLYTRSRTLVTDQKRIKEYYFKNFIECVHSVFALPSPFKPPKHTEAV
ncbi:LysR family transcriptional regulator [Oryzomonas sagensis]|uniref:LysR family transcriptional regulator n=1 Tax=Oryzomonas sagensis TaxID=2603857 RepID=A0ABQ6TM15_9BACT|nr:LysR family transcriptional regulator [Oryzomonas sagensis]KAB0669066.1 LysR family transcriptional regulator [Oryzomonas sagensis]